MIARITPRPLRGNIAAIPSKSEAHRLLICASLADRPTLVAGCGQSEDIHATVRCLNAFGADIRAVEDGMLVTPIQLDRLPAACVADCGESGSTLRFLLPLAGALGIEASFVMHGRLPNRPIHPLDRELARGGCTLDRPNGNTLRICGRLRPGTYSLPGNVSSQFITGMLLALSLLDGESRLEVCGRLESAGYIDLTLQAMNIFGMQPVRTASGFSLSHQPSLSPGRVQPGGDWSNAAFWLCCDGVEVTGLDPDSAQGDRRAALELALMKTADSHSVDVSAIPDLAPALAAFAATHGTGLAITHAQRLRLKESDRIAAIITTLNTLGAQAQETQDGLILPAGARLTGGRIHSMGDHRIAMMAAIASTCCRETVEICGAEAVAKSDPDFWNSFASLGGQVDIITEEEL